MFTGAELTLIQAQEASSSIFSFGLIVTCKQSYKVQSKFVLVRGITVCLQDTNAWETAYMFINFFPQYVYEMNLTSSL